MPAYLLEAYVVLLGLVVLTMEAFGPAARKHYLGFASIGGLIFGLVLLFFAASPADAPDGSAWPHWPMMEHFYTYDRPAIFYKGLALLCTITVIFMSLDYRKVLERFTENPGSEEGTGEYYALPIFACAGMMWMASAKDLVSIFVALELVTITFYVLVAFMRRNVGSLEAGVKYLILGALSTGILVYGIAWIYGTTGTTSLAGIEAALAPGAPALANPTALLFGLALLLIALAFKIGAVPMQLWIPDVYQGAPTPTTAFLSVGSKAAGFIITLRILEPFLESGSAFIQSQTVFVLLILSGLTLLYGNLAAIPQGNFKRLMAYSSIAHAGFLLLVIAAWQNDPEANSLTSAQVVSFYLATYFLMTMGVFFALVVVHTATGSEEIAAFDGLAKRNPGLALCTTILLSSLAGLPLTAGFFGKFFAFQLAIDAGLWWGVGIAFVGVAAGFYYYFKTVRAMYWRSGDSETPIKLAPITKYALGTFTIATVVLGIYPMPILWLLGAA
jgi:NADH-quinone oxidoreductase subunit N